MNGNTEPRRMTEESLTLEEANEIVRFERMTEEQQHMYLTHLLDQFEAIPSYAERFKARSSSSSAESSTP